MATATETPTPYPAMQLWRVKVSLVAMFTGWLVWWVSMFLPAMWEGSALGPKMATTRGYFALAILGAICFPKSALFPDADVPRNLLPICSLCFAYFPPLIGSWWPIVFRSRISTIWIWRLLSLGLLAPWYAVYLAYIDTFGAPPGCGSIVWAVGSLLIGLATWISPLKIPGEPLFAWTVLYRAKHGQPILTFRIHSYERAFPVVRDDSTDATT